MAFFIDLIITLQKWEQVQILIFDEGTKITNIMIFDFEPGDKVVNPNNKEWGVGQIQSIIKEKITVNFENAGKKVINGNIINLEKFKIDGKK